MPSYRVVIAVIDVRPGVAPPDVLPAAERMLARTHRVEDRKLDVDAAVATLTLRFLVPGSNDDAEDAEALDRGRSLVAELSELVVCGPWSVRRRDGRAPGGWPRVGGGIGGPATAVPPPGRALVSDAEAERRGFGGPHCARRREVLRETLRVLAEAPAGHHLRLAERNLARWAAGADAAPEHGRIEVVAGDWGEVTARLTRRCGVRFAVLTMANAFVPGGAYVEGAVAQEENLFRRTDAHLSITSAEYDAARDRYRDSMTRLLSAADGRVWLDLDHPRVCLRGPEDRARADLGYRWLDDDEIFPFVELRAAAVDRRDGSPFDAAEMRRRIAAQLDTLVDAGVRHAVLSAFGCGAFGNPAPQVAAIYRDEIDRRRASFGLLAFAIHDAGYGPDNLTPFAEALG